MERNRQERGARSQLKLAIRSDVETVDVLSGNLLVRANIKHVDAVDRLPQVVHRLGDHPACHQGLAKPHLVGDEEAGYSVGIEIQSAKHVIHGIPLEILERGQDFIDLRAKGSV